MTSTQLLNAPDPQSVSSRQLAKTLEEIPESILFSNLATLSLTRLSCLCLLAYGRLLATLAGMTCGKRIETKADG